jgi:hypothetical protein
MQTAAIHKEQECPMSMAGIHMRMWAVHLNDRR